MIIGYVIEVKDDQCMADINRSICMCSQSLHMCCMCTNRKRSLKDGCEKHQYTKKY